MLLNSTEMKDGRTKEYIEIYLSEEDKDSIRKKHRPNKHPAQLVYEGEFFLLHAIAKKVQAFIENGHYTSFLAYGVDRILDHKVRHFTKTHWPNRDELEESVGDLLYEEWQEYGEVEDKLLDAVYVWFQLTPFQSMELSEPIRNELHKAIDWLWLCPAVDDQALALQAHEAGKKEAERVLYGWLENFSLVRPGCGYENIIKTRDF